MNLSDGYDRVDVVCDRYFERSVKSQTRNERGQGAVLIFNDETQFPANFAEIILKNDNNKESLIHFLADKLIQILQRHKILTVSKGAR